MSYLHFGLTMCVSAKWMTNLKWNNIQHDNSDHELWKQQLELRMQQPQYVLADEH